jgi:Tol biopolymer transport system component
LRLTQLTHNGDSSGGAWSPDGRTIVFTSGNGDCTSAAEHDIETMNADGSHHRAVSTNGASFAASFSPDGRRIAYTSGNVLVIADRDGSHRRVVAGTGGGYVVWTTPMWSADGRKLLYGFFNDRTNAGALRIVSAAPSQRRFVVLGGDDGVWAPATAMIAYARCTRPSCDSKELWLKRLAVSQDTRLTTESTSASAQDGEPSWSPDGTRIAFVRSTDHGSSLVVLNVKDRREHTLVHGGVCCDGTEVGNPNWSPDGSLIAFSQAGIWITRPDGSGLRRLTGRRLDHDPIWRP